MNHYQTFDIFPTRLMRVDTRELFSDEDYEAMINDIDHMVDNNIYLDLEANKPRYQSIPVLFDKEKVPGRHWQRLAESFDQSCAFYTQKVENLVSQQRGLQLVSMRAWFYKSFRAVNQLPDADNTMIIYSVGDNGASSEGGPDGTLNEVKALNGFPTPLEENLKHLEAIGGPDGEPHYPVGWAWSGNAPFQWVKQVASHLGGTRNPMIVTWPARIKDRGGIRTQFTHLIDVVPTILEAAHLPTPKTVDGVEQKPLDGVSFLSTFDDAKAKPVRQRQY
jgi:hypothetical protein